MADRIGQRLGNYRLVRLLGTGAFAEVYLGEHVYLETQAAVKILHTQLAADEIEHFRHEARTIAHLEHPHIVRVLDFGVEENTPFLIMNYAQGGTLRQRHPKNTRLPLPTVVSYVQQIADALHYAHTQHLIHRDVKPENLFVGRNNEILLGDFGLVLFAQSSRYETIAGIAGTIAYMAPEQLSSHPRPASDQYALGVVVYEWLCGERPFQGSFMEVAAQQATMPPPPLREKVPTLSPLVEQVVLIALSKDPSQRFATVKAFSAALEQASNASSSKPPISRVEDGPNQSVLPTIRVAPSGQSPAIAPFMPSNQSLIPTDLLTRSPQSPPTLRETPLPSGSPFFSGSSPTDQGQSSVIPVPSQPARRGISRRTVLLGLAGLGVVGAVGGSIALLESARKPPASPSSPASPSPPSTETTMFGFNPQHTRFNPDEHILSPANVSHLRLLWARSLDGIIALSSPAVANGMVYIGSFDHKLYAVSASSGKILWIAPTQDIIWSSPAVANGIVYIGSFDHKCYAFNATTGKPVWRVPVGAGVLSSPAVVNGVVYIGSGDRRLYALDASTGSQLWNVVTGNSINSSPAVAGSVVYIGSDDGILYALDTSTGGEIWRVSTGGKIFDSPAVANGMVYFGTQVSNSVYAVEASTGKIKWKVKTGGNVNSSPAVAGGVVYIGSRDHNLYALDALTGRMIWKALATAGAEIASSPMIANGVLYVGSWDYSVYALDARTGMILWHYQTGFGIESSPVVVNSRVYIGSRDHNLYAFALPGTSP